jgi:threonine dehydratase
MKQNIPTYQDIQNTAQHIKPYIHRTPIVSSQLLNTIAGCEVFFKCENMQKAGAFKFRGASNTVFSLTEEEAKYGVATHSSGNHAGALAKAAQLRGIKAYIVMPDNSPKVKINAVKAYGAEITFCEPNLQARESTLEKVIERTGARFIHPYDIPEIIMGQGTAALELLEDKPDLEIVMAPVGGGGLLSGTIIASKGFNKNIKVIAGEPEGANDAFRSFKQGKFIPSENPDTICDGLLTSLGELTYEIIMNQVDDILTASEESIKKALRIIWERTKIIVEPSSAISLACILEHPEHFKNKKVGIIISGGNVDLDMLHNYLT